MPFHNNVEFVAFDLETTGLSSGFDRIVEIGAVRFNGDGTEISRMEQLVDPCRPIPMGAIRVHGITDDMVRGQLTIEDALPLLMEMVGDSDTVLLAHNAPFDIGFLSVAFHLCGISAPENLVVDTCQLSRCRIRRIRNHKLGTVAQHFQIDNPSAHRALGDALTVQSIFLKLVSEPPPISQLSELFMFASPLRFESMMPIESLVPAGYEPLAEAVQVGRCVFIVYDGGTKGRQRRQVTPKSIVEHGGGLYMVAHCHIDDMEKNFRLDRILEFE